MRAWGSIGLCLWVLAGCDDAASPEPPTQNVIRPAQVEQLGRDPVAVTGPLGVVAVTALPEGALIGAGNGLFLAADPPIALDDAPVLALVATEGGALVAGPAGLAWWDGEALAPSPLTEALEGHPVQSMARVGDALWIGTAGPLFVLRGEVLERHADLAGVTHITGDADTAAVMSSDGPVALQRVGDGWQRQDLKDEPVATVVVGRAGLLGAADGGLWQRVAVEEGAVWRPVVLGDDAEPTTDVEALASDPDGEAWALTADRVVRLGSDGHGVIARPAGAPADFFAVDGAGDVWIGDATQLFWLPADGEVRIITWADDIEPLRDARCANCHNGLGVGPTLHDRATWTARIDLILERVGAGEMPPGVGLGPAEALRLNAWKDGGLR